MKKKCSTLFKAMARKSGLEPDLIIYEEFSDWEREYPHPKLLGWYNKPKPVVIARFQSRQYGRTAWKSRIWNK